MNCNSGMFIKGENQTHTFKLIANFYSLELSSSDQARLQTPTVVLHKYTTNLACDRFLASKSPWKKNVN